MSPAEWGLSWEPGKRPQLSYRHRALAVHVGVTVTLSCRDMPTLTIPTQVAWLWLGLEVIWRVVVPADGVSCHGQERGYWKKGRRTHLKEVVAKGTALEPPDYLTLSHGDIGGFPESANFIGM